MSIAGITVCSDHRTSLFNIPFCAGFPSACLGLGCKAAPLFLSVNLFLCHHGLILPLVFAFHLLPKKELLSFSPLLPWERWPWLSYTNLDIHSFPDSDCCTSAMKWTHHTKRVVAIWALISLLAAPQCDGDKWLTDARWCTLAESCTCTV